MKASLKQSSSSKRFVEGSLKDPIHLYVTPMCTVHSAVINCSKLVDDRNTIKGIVRTREAFVGCHLRMLNFLLTQLRAHSSAIFEGGLCLFALAPQQPSTHTLCNTTIGATVFKVPCLIPFNCLVDLCRVPKFDSKIDVQNEGGEGGGKGWVINGCLRDVEMKLHYWYG